MLEQVEGKTGRGILSVLCYIYIPALTPVKVNNKAEREHNGVPGPAWNKLSY